MKANNPLLILLFLLAPLMGGGCAHAGATEGQATALEAAIGQYAAEQDFSGTILVERSGATLYRRSFGLADRAFEVPATDDTRYRIASITKLFTAVLVLQLVDEGKLDLDRPIGAYLPDFPGEGADRINLHHLLNHTSGIVQYDRVATLEQALSEGVEPYQRPQTAAQLLQRCCSGPLARDPGTAFDYNNADYILLGRIIEQVTGMTFEEALTARILRPLGLGDTGIARQDAIIARLAPTYYRRPHDGGLMNDLPTYYQNSDAAGGMYSTAPDVLAFARALFGGRLLRPATLERMLVPGLDDYGYGLWSYAFERNGRRHRVAKRPGSIMGANTVLYRLLYEDATIVILANTNHTDLDVFAQRIGDLLVGAGPLPTPR